MSAGTDREFKQFVDRVLRCREAEDDAKTDTKAVYAEFATWGGDKAALGGLVNELRRKEKNGPKFEEATATLGVYREAYERASHVYAREGRQLSAQIGQLVTTPKPRVTKASSVETTDFVTTPHDAETGEIPTQEQPVNPASQSASDVNAVACEYAGTSSDENPAPIPHSSEPISSQVQADKTSEAVLSPTASLAPPIGTKHTNTNFGSDPLNNAPSVEADQAGADAAPMLNPVPATPSAMSARTKGDVIRLMRPFCAHADDLGKCGGQGTKHCNDCEQIKRTVSVPA